MIIVPPVLPPQDKGHLAEVCCWHDIYFGHEDAGSLVIQEDSHDNLDHVCFIDQRLFLIENQHREIVSCHNQESMSHTGRITLAAVGKLPCFT